MDQQTAVASQWTKSMRGERFMIDLMQKQKRLFLTSFFVFFSAFVWLYVIYKIHHKSAAAATTSGAIATPSVAGTFQPVCYATGSGTGPYYVDSSCGAMGYRLTANGRQRLFVRD